MCMFYVFMQVLALPVNDPEPQPSVETPAATW